MQNNPLLPFAFTRSESSENPLDTTPRDRNTRDENAESIYHTRKPINKAINRPVLKVATPSLKRKPGASFSEKDDVKRREIFDSEEDEEEEEVTQPSKLSRKIDDFDTDTDETDHETTRVDEVVPPSSPPIHILHFHSELDISTKPFEMPDSPRKKRGEHDDDITGGSHKASLRHLSSDADFGIDRFNRFRAPSSFLLSTDDDKLDKQLVLEQKIQQRARERVLQAFEDTQTTINLEGMQLKEIPEEIKDLDNLVVFNLESHSNSQLSYQLYLTNNQIRNLPPSLFNFTKLNVLGLRQNKISQIPSLISKLKNLTDLYIGTNRLQYLPDSILQLSRLSILLTGPNPFITVPDDAIQITTATINSNNNKKFATNTMKNFKATSLIPSLKSICLNSIAKYDVSYQETKNWKKFTPKLHHGVIAKAISRGQYNQTCSECDLIVVEPICEAYEWWDILGNRLVPIKKEFCSGRCLKKWEISIIQDSSEAL